MSFIAASVYWVIVFVWLTVLLTLLVFYVRNPPIFGTTRLLLAVVAIDTLRNVIENVYFGVYFGAQYGMFPAAAIAVLGNPYLIIIPKLLNLIAGCVVLGLLLLRWLPSAVQAHAQSEQNVDALTTLAAIDGLTGLYNKRQFEVLGQAEWARYQRYRRPTSLLLIDLDKFKAVNDQFGHDAGDNALKAVSSACNFAKRKSDISARIGGDEFAILLPETTGPEAQIVAERLRDLVRLGAFPLEEGVNLTVSIGIASATIDMSDFATLMKHADVAMYQAKSCGRNRVASAQGSPSKTLIIAA
jgi:diguanylate cyclase (GGDEF)-like protein